MRNISPRQGTETLFFYPFDRISKLRNISPRQGTETSKFLFEGFWFVIEKYKSPTGDGNKVADWQEYTFLLRNISPRQGTETLSLHVENIHHIHIEKYKSPTGDGNGESFLLSNLKTD